MSIIFDNSGHIDGFTGYFTGNFDIILPIFTITKNFAGMAGSGNSNCFLQNRSEELRFRFGEGGSTIDLAPLPLNTSVSDGRITRVDGVITFTMGGNTKTANSTGAVDFREWGRSSGSALFQGTIEGVATLSGEGRETITHDFDSGQSGDTVLVNQTANTAGSNDGTLKNFTSSGGFQGTATPTPSVANAGADQSNISAGDEVILNSSASTGVVSRSWSEVTSTGVTLSDDTAVSPTFTAPSFTELTEITFLLTTTGSDGTEDTDEVSFFVLEDGVAVSDPTITILTPYAYQTKEADSLFEAIFNLTGVITDLPAGATAEYQVDDGNWITAATDSSGNFATDVIITKQQKITVRVSTHTDITDVVSYVTSAPTWLAWWQSNESGRGASTQNSVRNELADTDPRPTMFKNGVWQRLADPTSEDSSGGSTWVRIAVEYAKLGIPIGVINVAVGGTSIERWLPSSNDLWTTRIIQEVTEADCGITYTTSLGGESNVGTDSATLRAWLEEMINGLHTEFGSTHYLTYVPRSYENGQGDTLRGEFDYAIANNPYCKFGGDTEVVDLSTSGDGTHLNSSSQVNEAALIRFNAFTAVAEENTPPTANAGTDLPTVTAGAQFQLNGSGVATQAGAAIVGYSWAQISAGTAVALSNPLIKNPTGVAPSSDTAQTLTYELTVTDSNGLTAKDTVNVPVAAVVVAAESSNLSITVKGSGSGTHEVSIFEISDLSTVIYNGDATFTDDVMDVDIDLEVGVQIVGLWVGDNFPNTGGSFEGVTK